MYVELDDSGPLFNITIFLSCKSHHFQSLMFQNLHSKLQSVRVTVDIEPELHSLKWIHLLKYMFFPLRLALCSHGSVVHHHFISPQLAFKGPGGPIRHKTAAQ